MHWTKTGVEFYSSRFNYEPCKILYIFQTQHTASPISMFHDMNNDNNSFISLTNTQLERIETPHHAHNVRSNVSRPDEKETPFCSLKR